MCRNEKDSCGHHPLIPSLDVPSSGTSRVAITYLSCPNRQLKVAGRRQYHVGSGIGPWFAGQQAIACLPWVSHRVCAITHSLLGLRFSVSSIFPINWDAKMLIETKLSRPLGHPPFAPLKHKRRRPTWVSCMQPLCSWHLHPRRCLSQLRVARMFRRTLLLLRASRPLHGAG